ncbi:AAA family ATPase [Kribbella sandramycini]|uniref:AAA family ATPase n=1 Tax=Kribbella sandramycini TaxID=60450 RepID=A0A7Y4P0D0_9ACTN|nr:MinD-like ATPase involved in chromosome partitioning or flagellar assembly [Kribbella sandramycini]NOL41015.1 AAA family ATPase [Kribbella sandramycini]
MTDSHNSGQHKDREAAAAEVRRMWQPTPSWTQPDPAPAADAETADQVEEQESAAEEFPGDSWSRPAAQAAPWNDPKNAPGAQSPAEGETPSRPGPSWTQPAAETSSWSQPRPEPKDFDDEAEEAAEPASASGTPGAGGAGTALGGGLGSKVPESSEPAAPSAPVFGGASFSGGQASGQPSGGQPSGGQQGGGYNQPGGYSQQGGQQQGGQLSPAAQHFFPQGIPGQNVPQQRDVSYRTDDLMQALPLPREAPAERGVRSVLRLKPGTSERSERIARATAATAFRRPVTIVVANPKGGSGKTPTTLLLAGALGQARGGGVVAWDNNELRGNMHLRTHDTNARSTVTDMLQAMPMLTQPDARLGDVAAYLRHQVAGQYDVLTSATTTYAQIEAKDFDQIHRLLSRFYKVLVIDTGNNEGSSNWREAMKAADALVIPIKWKSLSCAAAVQMLEELDNQGPEAQRLIRRAVIAVSNGPGDVNKEVEKQLRPYFESRAAAVVDIPTDQHIAAEGPLDHSALQPATRRAGLELAAKVSEQISIALNIPR